MIVYVIRLEDKIWAPKGWSEEATTLPTIYPTREAAEKVLKSTPSKQSKPRFNAHFWGWDQDKIEIVEFNFAEKV
jgi:hypothetical protein